jgi:3-oxoacyl-[acyl-carrier-protein] synthase II
VVSGPAAPLAITGCGVLSPAGTGLEALLAALGPDGVPAGRPAAEDLAGAGAPPAHQVAGFDVRQHLGRKGTAFLDRATGLALVACGQALEDSGLVVDEHSRSRVGVVLGTAVGSLRSMSDYTRETLIEERPYLVNPALFPNTVMNCASGQSAIRYGLAGINATIAGGELAFLSVLRYVANALRRGYADALLAGAVEELSPHRAWAVHLADGASAEAGEGAAVLVVEPGAAARAAGRRVDAEVLAVTAGYDPDGGTRALAGCLRRAVAAAGVEAAGVCLAVSERSAPELEAVAAEVGLAGVRPFPWQGRLGECQAAAAGLQVATLLALHRAGSGGGLWAVAGRESDGTVAAAVLRFPAPS